MTAKLIQELAAADWETRLEAAHRLRELLPAESIPATRLAELLRDEPVWSVREALLESLERVLPQLPAADRDELLVTVVERAIFDRHELVQQVAVRLLLPFGEQLWSRYVSLLPHLSGQSVPVCCRVLRFLGTQPVAWLMLRPLLPDLLTHSHWRIRRTACESLGLSTAQLTHDERQTFLPVLLRRRDDGEPRVRRVAEQVLQQWEEVNNN